MTKPACPKCGEIDQFFYVERAYEYHTMSDVPYQAGYVDLCNLDDTQVDEDYEPELRCLNCHGRFNVTPNMEEKKNE